MTSPESFDTSETSQKGETVGEDVDDARLMRALSEGDRGALQLLVDRYWDRILKYSRHLLESQDEGEDVAQEVFVRVWQHRSRWIPGNSVSGYLYRIARNLILDRSKLREIRQKKTDEVRDRSLARREPTPAEEMEYEELRAAFEAAVGELPERRREAFLLVRSEGFTLAEAAEHMDLAPQTVANHVHLALTDLRDALSCFLPTP